MIDEFSKEANLEKSLVLELRNSLRYSTEHLGFTWSDKQVVFNELPRSLRYQIAIAMHRGAAKFLSFFLNKDMVLISSIIPFLTPSLVKSEQFVYKLNDYPDEMYFVVKGRLAIVHGTEGIKLKTLRKGDHFGDIEIIQQTSRKYIVKAITQSELLIMNKALLQLIMEDFPSVWQQMVEEARQKDESFEKLRIEVKLIRKLKLMGKFEVTKSSKLKGTIEKKYAKLINERQNSISKEPNLKDVLSCLADLKSQVFDIEKKTAELSAAFNEFKVSYLKKNAEI
jgi:CRP-like cAMP-binding protein